MNNSLKTRSICASGGGMLKQLLCASLLGLTTLSASAADMTPTLGEDSAYTVTEVTEENENTILTYEINKETYELTPRYYEIHLKNELGNVEEENTYPLYFKWEETDGNRRLVAGSADDHDLTYYMATDYGEVSSAGATATYFKWQDDGSGGRTLVSGSAADYDLIFWKDPTKNYNHVTIMQGGVDIDHGFAGLTYMYGSAIYNIGQIASITGDFIGNYNNSRAGANGGAIYNCFKIDTIIGNFIGNYVSGNESSGGAAIYNDNAAIIGDITGDFINNFVSNNEKGAVSDDGYNIGGAINNHGEISSITGDFVNNYISDVSRERLEFTHTDDYDSTGGAIANWDAKIGNITGDFIGNHVIQRYQFSQVYDEYYTISISAKGGAIYNEGEINAITGDFIGNYVSKNLDDIDINNKVVLTENSAGGGAIYNNWNGKISNITGDFIGNYVSSLAQVYDAYVHGGAIYNSGESGDITGDFIGNYVTASSVYGSASSTMGGAIYNGGEIGDITGDFISNYAFANSSYGGAIYSYGTIGNITGDFIGNCATATGANSMAAGGAIINDGIIGGTNISDPSKIIEVESYTIINSDNGDQQTFYYAISEGDMANIKAALEEGYKILVTSDVMELSPDEYKEALAEAAEYGNTTESPVKDFPEDAFFKITGGIINSSFVNNYAEAKNGTAQGGAINTSTDLNLESNSGYTSIISGNYVEDKDGKRPEAIYVDSADATLGINANTDGKFIIDDTINGAAGYTVKFTGDETGYVQLNNNIEGGANIELNDLTLHLATRDDVLNGNVLTANSGILNMINNRANAAELTNVTIGGDTKFLADVDLLNETMDRVTAPAYGSHSGNLHVVGMNLLTDAPAGRDTTEIYFAETGLMNNVVNGTGELPDQYQTAYTPIYKYNVDYEVREDDGGYFLFTRGGSNSGNPSDAFNPSVLNTPVANLAAGQATINETFKYVFEHADAFTQLPSMERMAQIKNDYYALSTDYNENLDVYGTGLAPEFHNDGAWVRPYVTFESMNLKNGPDVDAITYGTLIGFDSDFEDFGHGWTGVTTGYLGYNGSQLSYSGNDTSMNGGLLGLTQTFYKGDFWTAITASAGASVGETSTMYGSEDFTSLLAGVGSKTGYNFEFKEGKYILQPIMFLSYTFVNTFDYTNAAGVKIESDPLHTIQLNPSVRFIANLKNGWQPYASVGMVWNLLNQTDTTANGISLPDMHVKPYVEYGIGVQKRWADKFTAFFQTMIRNGGRNGVALTGGFRWSLGKDPDTTVNNVNKVKKVIKTLDTKVAGK